MKRDYLDRWFAYAKSHDLAELNAMLADDCVFRSPVVHTPQVGKAITYAYLSAAFVVLGSDKFRYTREFTSDTGAVLEFETEIDGIGINGVDIIEWNDAGLINDFKVMVRPLKAINLLHAMMGAQLEKQKKA
ncbi:nuclear transport factor 2 family protein [Sphingoaurantiacus capsulatus]|uniref:Nuclear transport factor 2 family protein n=1 Tax=Sphingoaurantiacus capsulatus TaxID=1771310 RepID=A0ABV7XFB7_9SPHN